MRTHRPIYLALDRPDRQVIITCAYHPIIGELFGHLIIASTHHHIESDRERILLDQLMVEVDGREGGPRIVETRHALPQELLTSQLCGAAELCSDLGWRPLRLRSEERRVGKECSPRRWTAPGENKTELSETTSQG